MLIGRKEDLEWLRRQSRLSPMILITGVRGIGKTKLIREWLMESGRKFSWQTIERFKDMPQLLKLPDKTIEAALEEASLSWQNVEAVVWDEAHLLSPAARLFLFSFLKSSPFLPLQIFLSDEEITDPVLFDLDIARRKIAPLSPPEIGEYLNEAGITDHGAAERATRATAGVPLLLHLWIQSGNQSTNQNAQLANGRVLQGLNESEQRALELASVLGRPFPVSALSENADLLDALSRKFLLDHVPGRADLWVVPSYIRSICLQAMESQTLRDRSAEIHSLLTATDGGNGSDRLEILLHALRSQDIARISQTLDSPESRSIYERIEHLSQDDLSELASLLAEPAADLPRSAALVLTRLRMRVEFLLGRRSESIGIGEDALTRISLTQELSQVEQELVLELVQNLNRSSRRSEARLLASRAMHLMSTERAFSMQVEQAVSWMPAEPARSKEILTMLIKTFTRAPSRDESKTQASFQLARSHDLLDEYSEAAKHYHDALEGFSRADRPYLAAVTLLNLTWLALKQRRWEELGSMRSRLGPLAERYGYGYVLAGLELIEAIEARLFLKSQKALQKVESCRRRLGTSAPLAARIDAETERVRILLSLGLTSQARSALNSLRLLSPGKDDSTVEKRISVLQLELQSTNLICEEWLDRRESLPEGSLETEFIESFRLRRGIDPADPATTSLLRRTPIGEVALAEHRLTETIAEAAHTCEPDSQDSAQRIWTSIARLEKLLSSTSDPLPERAALFLLQAMLSPGTNASAGDSAEYRSSMLQRAELELQRWGCDPETRAALEAWLESLRASLDSPRIAENPAWHKAPAGERERWRRWWQPLERGQSMPWLVLTERGRKESATAPEPSPAVTLHFVEQATEIHWKGRRHDELIRKHALRKLLSLLLEHCPDHADKEVIASVVWGEKYRPDMHDSRIYTAIQRLRALFSESSCIQNWERGYRWNPSFSFQLVRSQRSAAAHAQTRCQNLILQALERFNQSGRPWLPRSELVAITQSSEATVKRELAKLLGASRISRTGNGRSVAYSLKRTSAIS